MPIETDVHAAIRTVVPRCYFMSGPFNARRPFATYQFVGGRPTPTLCGEPVRKNYRIQVNIWDEVNGNNGAQSVVLMRQVIAALTAAPLRGVSLGGLESVYDEETKTFGARCDFSFWQ